MNEVELRATVVDHRQGPRQPLPQVAFAGRSNVGKSSLLNTLFGRRIAAVSKTPGKTRTINYYLVNRCLYFVDLPGYGYARVEEARRQAWGKSVTAYLEDEDRLALVLGLVDPRVPTSSLDLELTAFVRAAGRRLQVILTKADKLGRGALAQASARVRHDLELDHAPLEFSAHTGAGRADVLAAIARAVTA